MTTAKPEEILGFLNEVERKFAPKALYLAGNADLLQRGPKVSIVGSRKPTEGGRKRAGKLARLLVQRNAVVVSGLAEGIDTAAHTAAIDAGGATIAVLGTPLDIAFPTGNRSLQATIIRDHLAVSEFPVGYPVQRRNFVLRNRTMALLSDATVIIEAGETSGTQHQGWEAIRLGRPLYLLESLASAPGLTWPTKMLSYGAQVLSEGNMAAVLEALPSVALSDAVAF